MLQKLALSTSLEIYRGLQHSLQLLLPWRWIIMKRISKNFELLWRAKSKLMTNEIPVKARKQLDGTKANVFFFALITTLCNIFCSMRAVMQTQFSVRATTISIILFIFSSALMSRVSAKWSLLIMLLIMLIFNIVQIIVPRCFTIELNEINFHE